MLLLFISFSGERPPDRHSPLRVGLFFKVQSANEDFCRTSAQRRSREDGTTSCRVTTFNTRAVRLEQSGRPRGRRAGAAERQQVDQQEFRGENNPTAQRLIRESFAWRRRWSCLAPSKPPLPTSKRKIAPPSGGNAAPHTPTPPHTHSHTGGPPAARLKPRPVFVRDHTGTPDAQQYFYMKGERASNLQPATWKTSDLFYFLY